MEERPQEVTLNGDPKLTVDTGLDVAGAMAADEAAAQGVVDEQVKLQGDPKLVVKPTMDVAGAMAADEAAQQSQVPETPVANPAGSWRRV